MREIKFRAWNKKSLEMFTPVTLLSNYDSKSGAYKSETKDYVYMQFTGLKDKNGKEIYESDYLGNWCVYWGSGKYVLHNILSGDILNCDEGNTLKKEITGNRYETPREHTAMASDI